MHANTHAYLYFCPLEVLVETSTTESIQHRYWKALRAEERQIQMPKVRKRRKTQPLKLQETKKDRAVLFASKLQLKYTIKRQTNKWNACMHFFKNLLKKISV